MSVLDTDIEELPSVGARRAEPLRKAGVRTFGDLLRYYPRRYLDRSTVTPIRQLTAGEAVTVVGTVQAKGLVPGRGGRHRLELRVQDESGGTLKCVWFRGATYLQRLFATGDRVAFHGKPEQYGRTFSLAHPDFDKLDDEGAALDTGRIIPLYPGGAALEKVGLVSRTLRRLVYDLLKEHGLEIPEVLPAWVRDQYDLIPGNVALRAIHFPRDRGELGRALRRLKFEELFFLQLLLALTRERRAEVAGPAFGAPGDYARRFVTEVLPFTLTGAQQRATEEIAADTMSGRQMNRLVQGDVGSGKTVVAVAAMMQALDAGFQSAFMAPTEILTEQHYANLKGYLEPLGVEVRLLIGGQRKALREEILDDLSARVAPQVAVGTHALIEDTVEFANLGLAVVDEQHRFGVMQRAKMFRKGQRPHMLLMTATPIPRSLAMTVYGDLDVTMMTSGPPGRKPIVTKLYGPTSAARRPTPSSAEQLREGRQAYVVYPLVEESEKLDLKDAESGFERSPSASGRTASTSSTGGCSPTRKEEAMDRFKDRRDRHPRRDDGHRGRRGRPERERDGDRARRALRAEPAPPAPGPRRAWGRPELLFADGRPQALGRGRGAPRGDARHRRRLRDLRDRPAAPRRGRLLRHPAVRPRRLQARRPRARRRPAGAR